MEKKYSFYNNLLGFIAFFGASLVYLLTLEPTVSLWDCGEFIATAAKLEVGHPPGAPLFLILGRIAALFTNDPQQIAYCINAFSAIASGATIMFLFWTISRLAKKMFGSAEFNNTSLIVVLLAGLIGAGAFAFTDTFWFSAVEGEVYALSSLFTAVVFWAILKWESVAHKPHSDKWIILIAFIMGLSIGVHLLNLLTISAIVYIYYFKKFEVTKKGFILVGLLSLLIIAFILWGMIGGSLTVASKFELFFVNVLGMPFDSGFLVYLLVLVASFIAGIIVTQRKTSLPVVVTVVSLICILAGLPFMSGSVFITLLLLSGVIWGVYYLAKNNPIVLNTVVNVIIVIMIGFSSYAMIYVRSKANTPMNENAPDNVFSLLSYLNREQYGTTPLVYGPYYNAVPKWESNGQAKVKENFTHTPRKNQYVEVSNGMEYVFNSDFCTIFPRMHSREEHHIREYKKWAGIKEGENTNSVSDASSGGTYEVPTFGQNLKFFFSYQIGHMYVRYFMWNFAGRQNDVQSHGGITNGNWITGLPFIDKMLVGDQTEISEITKNDATRNTYFLLPFILGLIGLIFHFKQSKRDSFIVTLLFLLTGLAIVVYLNQTPYQPRERDYAYAGSFYAFAIWIGISVLAFYTFIKKYVKIPAVAIGGALLITVPTPIVLASQNWADHDRSNRFTAHDFASNYMQSCDPNSIIVTAGDNDTFPIWYIQEVEEERTDVRVLCSPLLATHWYSQQIMRQSYLSAPLPLKLTSDQVAQGIRDAVRVVPFGNGDQYVDLSLAMGIVRDDSEILAEDNLHYLPANKLKFAVNKKDVFANKVVSLKDSALVVPEITFTINDGTLYRNKLVIYDILDGYKWDRPLYFTNSFSAEEVGLGNYLRYDGFVYKFVPVKNLNPNLPYIDTKVMYDNIMNKYKWGGLGEKNVHVCHFNNRQLRVIGVRQMFNMLAISLIQENNKPAAKKVLQKLRTILPNWQVPYFDENIVYTAHAYYLLGDVKTANEELMTFAKNVIDEIEWFNSLAPAFKSSVEQEQMEYIMSLTNILEMALRHNQTDLIKKLEFEWKRVEQSQTLMQVLEMQRQYEAQQSQQKR